MQLKINGRANDTHKHNNDVNSLLFHKGFLYSAADDGKIKLWSSDLKLEAQVEAHPCSVYCLTASDDTLYSCSNEGTIKAWTLDGLKEKKTVDKVDNEFWRICFMNGVLYAGDDLGTIRMYTDDKFSGQVMLLEPVKDMLIFENTVYTAQSLDVVISEIISGGAKERYSNKKNIMGRAPLAFAGDKLCFADREGKGIIVHENSAKDNYKEVAQVKDAHEMIINALIGGKNDSGTYLYSGGWDKVVKLWKIENDEIKLTQQMPTDIVINCFAAANINTIYAAGSDGNIIRISV